MAEFQKSLSAQHELRILESDRSLRDAVSYVRTRRPLCDWPESLRLSMVLALSETSSENPISAYRAEALYRHLQRLGILGQDGRATVSECLQSSVLPADASIEYAKDRLLADLLPAIARQTAHERRRA